MSRETRRQTRLFVILAREARVGAVVRRGPTGQVLLMRWHLADDTFEAGQWFNGRIYERRCDLSPDGDRFIYFAATHRPPFGTWTAVSRLPYLTALALWRKGDAWGGGGLFRSHNEILLNHLDSDMTLQDGHTGSSIAIWAGSTADWDSTGDLLMAAGGKLHRHAMQRDGSFEGAPRVLVDLSDLRFELRPPPLEATRWNGPRPRGIRLP